jgi:hypothetical protein
MSSLASTPLSVGGAVDGLAGAVLAVTLAGNRDRGARDA